MQREMPVHGEPRGLQNAPDELVRMCRHGLDAIRLCVQLSGYTHEHIGSELGIDKGHFSRIMQGKACFPDTKRTDLMNFCGNRAPAQYDALMTGCDLVEKSKDAKIRELEEQLAQLRAA
ncbi:hypothetical protein C7410_115196 [Paraburkholderia silvatlantica]|uniref:Uncharacterized protein n=1 Tax=Paraburkholderia silvatlantica TaxID=321895 RepID=A0A2V4TT82_9BURK|nr:hypothetical protein [Paraburkholderia silvatlantica]PYE21353.1 hypothetical protein C7410_115196 [Paraburkholderia silvatlantica]